jgi:hypothetical protein
MSLVTTFQDYHRPEWRDYHRLTDRSRLSPAVFRFFERNILNSDVLDLLGNTANLHAVLTRAHELCIYSMITDCKTCIQQYSINSKL